MKGTRVVLAWLAVHLAACAFCQDVSGVLDRIRRGDANAIAEVVRVGPAAVPPILSVLDTARGDERLNLVVALTRIGSVLQQEPLERLIEDPDPRIRIVVLTNLERLTDSSHIVSLLTRALGDPETSVATVALQQLLLQLRYRRGAENFFRAHPSLAPFLIPELASDDRTARMAAAYALLSAPMWEERYLQVIESENAVEPVAYLVSQHEADAPALANALIAKGTSGEPEERIALLDVAVRYPTSESRAYVSQRLHDGDWR
ncbi:MAG: hypothetical protein D6724_07425, partial [Armatimonadetes bacterium]